jgi:acyl carrier protein
MNVDSLDICEFYRNLEEVLDLTPGTLSAGELLAQLEAWDSVAVLGFLVMADETYSALIPPKRIPECKTVDDLAALIRQFSQITAHG